jgi:excinuclease ABC subunit B
MSDTLMMAFAEEQAVYNSPEAVRKRKSEIEKKMLQAAGDLEFEEAARLRDELRKLEAQELGIALPSPPRQLPGKSKSQRR